MGVLVGTLAAHAAQPLSGRMRLNRPKQSRGTRQRLNTVAQDLS